MLNLVANGSSTGYNLNNSLRFRQSANGYLSRTPASASNRKTWTWSGWVKLGTLGTDRVLFSAGSGATDSLIYISSGNIVYINTNNASNIYTTLVLRDPSAWYHIVVVLDTTQATAANRVKLYINGTLTNTATSAPTQNTDGGINNNIQHLVGGYASSPSVISYDGYMAEVNFVDGQALTPSSFGSTNATTGVWQPAKYTGTYGTNGFYLPFKTTTTTTYAGSFNGSTQYVTAPDNAAWAFSGDFTLEAWFNATSLSNSHSTILAQWVDAGGTDRAFSLGVNTNGSLEFYNQRGANQYFINPSLSTITINTNDWYHIAGVLSGTTLTLYINGINVGSTTVTGSINNSTAPLGIGAYGNGTNKFAGYISNVRITNTAVYTANFTPPTSDLTAITGTQLLTCQNATFIDNSTNAFTITNNGTATLASASPFVANIASDASGNNNGWTTNNINYTTAGTTYDAMTDVPTLTSTTVANYAVWNPLSNTAGTLSSANLKLTGISAIFARCNSTMQVSSGKWYFETTLTVAGSSTVVGIGQGTITDQYVGQDALSYAQIFETAKQINNDVQTSYGTALTTSDIFMCAFDLDNNKIFFGKNGTWFASSNPVTGANPAYTLTAGSYGVVARPYTTGVIDLNCGQRPFTYTAPTGFVALNTYNLPTPTILQVNKYMDATLWTGTGGASRTFTGLGFQPDLVWIKSRSAVTSHRLFDSVRGATYELRSNTTDAEAVDTAGGYVSSFNSNGFTVSGTTTDNQTYSGRTYVGWQWQANQGSTVSNTSGSITSTVSANTTAGFSVVTYTGTGANATVGHGLGVAPKMIIVKARSVAGYDWTTYHAGYGNTGAFFLNQTAAVDISSTYWQNTSPTSTVFSIGTSGNPNRPSTTYVAYCWAEIAGFSKIGSYVGNGANDGTFVYCGFRPKYIMMRSTSTLCNWTIVDTSRDTYNLAGQGLYSNLSSVEDTPASVGAPVDILSNGFKLRYYGQPNTAHTYIFMAFAENPFKNANAR